MRTASIAGMVLALLASPSAAHQASLPVGACLNAGNHLEFERENFYGGKVLGADDFQRMRAAGFETVRIPVRWSHKTGGAPDHAIEEEWMVRVEQVVDAALAADLNVILDSHNFEELNSGPQQAAPKLAAIWRQVGARFANHSERLWFELANEPNDAFGNANLVATLAPSLAAIRETNPGRAVIIGGGDWSNVDSLATLDLPDDPHVHPTFHYYDPFDFTHQGAEWAGPPVPAHTRRYGRPEDAERLLNDKEKVRAYTRRTGMVPFIGETGAFDETTQLSDRIAFHSAVTQALGPEVSGVCAWAYTNTFHFWDHDAQAWIPGLRAAMGLPED